MSANSPTEPTEPWHHRSHYEDLLDEASVWDDFNTGLSAKAWECLWLEDDLTQHLWLEDFTQHWQVVEARHKTLEASTVSSHEELSVHHQSQDSLCDKSWLKSLDHVPSSAGLDFWFPGDAKSRRSLFCKPSSTQEGSSTHELMRSSILGHEHDEILLIGARKQQIAPSWIRYRAGLRRLTALIMPCIIIAVVDIMPRAAAMEHQLQAASPRETAGGGWFNTVVDLSVICAVPAAIIGLLKDLSNEERIPWALGGIMAGLGFGSMFVVGDPRMPDALQISVIILWGLVTMGFIIQKVAKGQMGVWCVFQI